MKPIPAKFTDSLPLGFTFEKISKQLQNMSNPKVWEEVLIRNNIKLIGNTWVFKTERDENIIPEHKAHLCAQGVLNCQVNPNWI